MDGMIGMYFGDDLVYAEILSLIDRHVHFAGAGGGSHHPTSGYSPTSSLSPSSSSSSASSSSPSSSSSSGVELLDVSSRLSDSDAHYQSDDHSGPSSMDCEGDPTAWDNDGGGGGGDLHAGGLDDHLRTKRRKKAAEGGGGGGAHLASPPHGKGGGSSSSPSARALSPGGTSRDAAAAFRGGAASPPRSAGPGGGGKVPLSPRRVHLSGPGGGGGSGGGGTPGSGGANGSSAMSGSFSPSSSSARTIGGRGAPAAHESVGIIPRFYVKGRDGEPGQYMRPTSALAGRGVEPMSTETAIHAAATSTTATTSALRDPDAALPSHIKEYWSVGKASPSSAATSEGINVLSFVPLTKDVCGFPSFFNTPLFRRILLLYGGDGSGVDENNSGNAMDGGGGGGGAKANSPSGAAHHLTENSVVTLEMFTKFYNREILPYDSTERFFRLIKAPTASHIMRDDFLPSVEELLSFHPGLSFLSDHLEFQEKYAITVITRIFYVVDKLHTGRISLRSCRRSPILLESFNLVDVQEDINKVTNFFSYEHFYVLYCRFWELDTDRDYSISRQDLMKYGEHSLSHLIVDRIFEAGPRPFGNGISLGLNNSGGGGGAAGHAPNPRDHMAYEDFIYFMLSEEDKSNELAVRYWFACLDVDGDGILSSQDMKRFYAVQMHRMQCLGHEVVQFEDMLCQMYDMIKPSDAARNKGGLVVPDFLQGPCERVSGSLFDALFNLNKYLMFEQRDPFLERQKRDDEFQNDWDRYASVDYNRLAMEEEERETDSQQMMELEWNNNHMNGGNQHGNGNMRSLSHLVGSINDDDDDEDDDDDDDHMMMRTSDLSN